MREDGRFDLTVTDGIAHLRINRPDRLNALNADMIDELGSLCADIERRRDIAVVILSGEGRVFCAGGDIDAWSGETPQQFGQGWVRDGHRVFDALARLRQPLIAVLNGHALGGGLELAACADYRIAESHVRIGQPETGLGIIPGWSGTQRAVRRFGAQAVRRMALFGVVYSAEEALREGLVDEVVDTGEGLEAGRACAQALMRRGPEALTATIPATVPVCGSEP